MTGNGEAVNLGEKVGVEFGRRLQLGVLYERIINKKNKNVIRLLDLKASNQRLNRTSTIHSLI